MASLTMALVGSLGTKVQTAVNSIASPTFGQTTTVNNLLILWVSVTGTATLPGTPAGWNIAKQQAGTSSSATVYYKIAAGSDTAPTIAAIASGLTAAQLGEFSNNVSTSAMVVDKTGGVAGTTSPQTATFNAADGAIPDLWVASSGDFRSVARASNDTWTGTNITAVAAGNNNGVSSVNHYSFAYDLDTSANASADSAILTLSVTTSITGIAVAAASFRTATVQSAQAQATIKAFGVKAFGQSQADIKAIGQGYGQSQADVKAIGQGYGQARGYIFGAGFGQSQSFIRKSAGYAQANAMIFGLYPLPVTDTFTRSVSNALGQPGNGDTWLRVSGTAANAQVNGSSAVITTLAGNSHIYDLPLTYFDSRFNQGLEIYFEASVDTIADVASLSVSIYTNDSRDVNNSFATGWGTAAQFGANNIVTATGGPGVALGGPTISSYSVSTLYAFKVQILPSSNNTPILRMKAWALTSAEPGWNDNSIDITNPISGHIRLGINNNSNLTIITTIDNISVKPANITRTGQAQADILAIGKGFGQSQADIKATSNGFAQSQADIKTLGYGFAQSNADIKAIGQGYSQSQADIKQTYQQYAQSQADILAINYGFGQGQADIKATSNAFGQAQAFIIYKQNGFAQASALIGGTYLSVIDTFTRSVSNGLGNDDNGDAYVYNTGTASNFNVNGSVAIIKPTTVAVGRYDLKNTLIIGEGVEFSGKISFDSLPTTGTTPEISLEIFPSTLSTSITPLAGVYLNLDSTGNFTLRAGVGSGSRAGTIFSASLNTFYSFKYQALKSSDGHLKRFKVWLSSNPEPGWSQVNEQLIAGKLFSIGHPTISGTIGSGNANQITWTLDDISIIPANITYSGQAQAKIKAIGQGFGQSQADILATSNGFAQSQADIKTISTVSAQAQAWISVRHNSFAQANALINGIYGYVLDTFTRSATNALGGPIDSGDTWALVAGSTGSGANVNGSVALLDTATNNIFDLRNTLIHNRGIEVSFQFSANVIPDVGNITFIIFTNVSSGGSGPEGLLAEIVITPTSKVNILAQGRATFNTAYVAGDLWNAKFNFIGLSNGNMRKAWKIWKQGNTEPNFTQTDDVENWPLDGHVRLDYSADANISSIPVWTIDNLNVTPIGLRGFGQAQAYIFGVSTNTGYGQSQADVKAIGYGFAQSQADILAVNYGFGQAQSDIKATEFGFSQSQADIKATEYGFGQAQSDIKQVEYGFGQSQSDIKQTYQAYAQANADVKQTSQGYGQAQATIRGNAFAQSQADIKATYQGYGQAQSDIKQTYQGYGQSQGDILQTYQGYGQSQGYITRINNGFGQAQACIKGNAFAQAQGTVKQTYQAYGQAQGNIRFNGTAAFGQAQGKINAFNVIGCGNAQADIKKITQGYSQAQADVKAVSVASGQAQGTLATTNQAYAQAQGSIKVTTTNCGQSQGTIKQTYQAYAQSQARIKHTYQGYGQANAYIILVNQTDSGNAQGAIKTTTRGTGQANSDILQTSNKYSQAQATIKTNVNSVAQSQANIKSTYQQYGQAQGSITTQVVASGQAQATILVNNTVSAQAQASIVKSGQSAQAQALIRILHELKSVSASDRSPFDVILSDRLPVQNSLADTSIEMGLMDSDITLNLSDSTGITLLLNDEAF